MTQTSGVSYKTAGEKNASRQLFIEITVIFSAHQKEEPIYESIVIVFRAVTFSEKLLHSKHFFRAAASPK